MGAAVFCEALVVAGGAWENRYMSSVEFYQSAINEWVYSSQLRQRRSCCAMVAGDKYLHVLGGFYNNKCLSSVERTDNLKKTMATYSADANAT